MPRTILITGSSSGIGQKTKTLLLEKGHTVIGIARRAQKKDHPNFCPISLDFEKVDELPKALKAIDPTKIDSLICNAGTGTFSQLEEFSYNEMKRLIDVNFLSQAYLVRYLLPHLKKKKRSDVIFMGSRAALKSDKTYSLYSASKFALRGFALALREECSASPVHVSMIHPGIVRTDFFDEVFFGPGPEPTHAIEAGDIAKTILHILEMRTGTVLDEIILSPLKRVLNFKK